MEYAHSYFTLKITENSNMEDEKKNLLCRICLNINNEKTEAISLFEKHNNIYVYEKINYVASIEIEEGDNLPDKICSDCLLALENACSFKQKCENSDAILHSSLQVETQQEDAVELPIKEEYEYDYLEESSLIPDQDNLDTDIKDQILDEPDNVPLQPKVQYICDDCGDSFTSKCKLRVHWKKVHFQKYLICPICKKAHKSLKAFRNHKKKKSKACITASKIRVEGEGKNRIFHCKECGLHSRRVHTLMNHLVVHTGERPYSCNLCNKSFTQISSLMGHKQNKHEENVREMTCELCGKNVTGRDKYYRHMRNHKGTLSCTVCNKVFAPSYLKTHMMRHSGVKTFACEICAKTFYTSSDLRNHKVKTHLKTRVYNCEECNYKCYGFSRMRDHRKGHKGNKVPCDHCGAFLENEQQLVLHRKRHFEKDYKCSICGKLYYGKKNLQNHVRKAHNVYGNLSILNKIVPKGEMKNSPSISSEPVS